MGTARASVLALADADGAPRASYALPAGVTAPLLDANEERPSALERAAFQSPSSSPSPSAITALQCAPDSTRLAAGISNGRIALLDVSPDGSFRPSLPPPQTTRAGCLVLLVSLR